MTLPGAGVIRILQRPAVRSWKALAACRAQGPNDWYPPISLPVGRPRRRDTDPYETGRAICWERCPVRTDCLAYALAAGEELGMWGGLDPDERAELRHDQAAAQ